MDENPYSNIPEDDLRKIYMASNPNSELMKRKYQDIIKKQIWDSDVIIQDQVEALRTELKEFLEDLLKSQKGLGAAITAINIQNHEMSQIFNKRT
jgi:hypothetical protein